MELAKSKEEEQRKAEKEVAAQKAAAEAEAAAQAEAVANQERAARRDEAKRDAERMKELAAKLKSSIAEDERAAIEALARDRARAQAEYNQQMNTRKAAEDARNEVCSSRKT